MPLTCSIRPPGAAAAQEALAGGRRAVECARAFGEHARSAAARALLDSSLGLARLALLLSVLQLQRQLPPALAQLCR